VLDAAKLEAAIRAIMKKNEIPLVEPKEPE
jgi:hypothetical protein